MEPVESNEPREIEPAKEPKKEPGEQVGPVIRETEIQETYLSPVTKNKPKRGRSEAQVVAFNKMRESKEKAQVEKYVTNDEILRRNGAMFMELEKSRKDHKTATWTKLIDEKFNSFEEKLFERLNKKNEQVIQKLEVQEDSLEPVSKKQKHAPTEETSSEETSKIDRFAAWIR